MNLHLDRRTAGLSSETRRLWDDVRVWVVNCLVVESTWPAAPKEERDAACRGRDRMLASIIEAW
jgi:hypothetical protein